MTRIVVIFLATAVLFITQGDVAAADSAESLYFAVRGGTVFLQDSDLTISVPGIPAFGGELFHDLGWAAGVALGRSWDNGMALEGELTYRENGLDDETVMGGPMGVDGTESVFAAMANARYNFDMGWPITPFFGAGIGAALLKIDAIPDMGGQFKDSDTEFAYQAMAGVSYALSSHVSLAVEYRYFATTNPTFEDNSVSVDMDYQSHDVFMSLSYDLQ